MAKNILKELGLSTQQVNKFPMYHSGHYAAITNFQIACLHFDLPLEWGQTQLTAFLIYVNVKFYTAPYLDKQWNIIKKLAETLNQSITDEQQADFELVKDHCREQLDNKVPASVELLKELCEAADKLFQHYNAKLAKAIFVMAWGGFMRISEYSKTSAKNGNKHNLREAGILLSDDGVSVNFLSDKVAKSKDPPKHRLVDWGFLPTFAKQYMEDYDQIRPQGAENYFCRESGEPLSRTTVLNLLEPCQLNTRWRFLSVPPPPRIQTGGSFGGQGTRNGHPRVEAERALG